MSVFTHLVAQLGRLLEPLLADSATAAAIVLFTVLVRLALHPLSRAAFRGATPVAGCLPVLLQLPVFFVMYRAFSSAEIGGAANELLGHRLFAAPLGDRWGDALGEGGLFGAQGLVFLGLFAVIAAVAAWSASRGRKTAALTAAAAEAVAAGAGAAGAGKAGGGKAGAGKAGGGRTAEPRPHRSFSKEPHPPKWTGYQLFGVDFWHAVEFSRNGRFLCTHPLGLSSGRFLRSCVSDSIRLFRA
ncbi:YidC/Oxa1 family membrane protein insertase [Streptomyces sp. ICC1]|uniref:YidC/Oxa1 family membrane protein insertase n=1 Tax=Streptomyces sp. ICC1 TaxID=2099583 RepID=UPI0013A70C7A|nr:YidC/Oxa1 family membrane protein insertase [Streptomyces sp. ICC1]